MSNIINVVDIHIEARKECRDISQANKLIRVRAKLLHKKRLTEKDISLLSEYGIMLWLK